MPDYKAMYLELFHATEDAVNRLIAAQQKCEDLYIQDESFGQLVLLSEKETEESNQEEKN